MGLFRGVLPFLGLNKASSAYGDWLFPIHAQTWGFKPLAGYEYKPLRGPDGIRLLKIQPGAGKEALTCQIFHTSLDYAPKYITVSYAWGQPSSPEYVACSGNRLPITPSLHSLLLHMRSRDKPTIIWVDQICIDQTNDVERGQQVQLMGEIYQHATCGIVWLGRADRSSEAGMSLARKVLALLEPKRRSRYPIAIEKYWPKEEGLPRWNHEDWADLGSILQRAWFRRAWVIQETVLARQIKLICGDDEMDWDDFIRVIESLSFAPNLKTLTNGGTSPPLIIQHILAINKSRKKWRQGRHQSLIELLFKFRRCDVTETRDKIYSLLGMSDRLVNPDYTVPLPRALVEVAMKLLSSTMPTNYNHYTHDPGLRRQGMGLLYSAGIANQRTALPSWVPDWNSRLKSRPLWQDRGSGYRAGGKSTTTIEFHPENAISVSGKVFDTIIHITEALDYKRAMRLHEAVGIWFEAARSILPSHLHRAVVAKSDKYLQYPAGGSYIDAFKKTIIANRVSSSSSGGYRPATGPDTERYYGAFEHLYKTRVMHWEGFRLHPEMMDVDWFHNIFAESHGRQFFITKRGYIGLTNKGTIVGDQVAVIKGGDVPVVLRKTEWRQECEEAKEARCWRSKIPEPKTEKCLETKCYKLVTECYLHGIMKGEISGMTEIREKNIVIT